MLPNLMKRENARNTAVHKTAQIMLSNKAFGKNNNFCQVHCFLIYILKNQVIFYSTGIAELYQQIKDFQQ